MVLSVLSATHQSTDVVRDVLVPPDQVVGEIRGGTVDGRTLGSLLKKGFSQQFIEVS